jgi:hypothetical protein
MPAALAAFQRAFAAAERAAFLSFSAFSQRCQSLRPRVYKPFFSSLQLGLRQVLQR